MPKLFSQNTNQEENTRQAIPLSKSKAELVNGIPISGEDYLLVVREQAKQYSKTSIAAAPPKTVKKVQLSSQFQFLLDQQSVSASNNQPATIWKESFIEQFRTFQEYKQNENRVIKDPKGVTTIEEWQQFCQSKTPESISEVTKTLTQHTILKLLKYYTQWLKVDLIENQCMWIFHLLIYLDPVMVSKNVSILRTLAKRAIEIRNNITEPYVNIIIVIIAVIYGQLDLIQ
ncbi:hypothetical protein K501DRAFT_235313 [Backusella circina FSU 941]|nr:hypothetical protein K501DRAFT_235313 [Backusella circina FSU 941]